jgi:hypothetical protein
MMKMIAATRLIAAAALVAVTAGAFVTGAAEAGVDGYDKTAKAVGTPDTATQKVLIPAIKAR